MTPEENVAPVLSPSRNLAESLEGRYYVDIPSLVASVWLGHESAADAVASPLGSRPVAGVCLGDGRAAMGHSSSALAGLSAQRAAN